MTRAIAEIQAQITKYEGMKTTCFDFYLQACNTYVYSPEYKQVKLNEEWDYVTMYRAALVDLRLELTRASKGLNLIALYTLSAIVKLELLSVYDLISYTINVYPHYRDKHIQRLMSLRLDCFFSFCTHYGDRFPHTDICTYKTLALDDYLNPFYHLHDVKFHLDLPVISSPAKVAIAELKEPTESRYDLETRIDDALEACVYLSAAYDLSINHAYVGKFSTEELLSQYVDARRLLTRLEIKLSNA